LDASDASPFLPGTPNTDQPIIDRREANTHMRVATGQTLVIGGLRQRTDNGSFMGIPHLEDHKWLGVLFRSRSTAARESELVVFLTPAPFKELRPRSAPQYRAHSRFRLSDYPPPHSVGVVVLLPPVAIPLQSSRCRAGQSDTDQLSHSCARESLWFQPI
jgi:type II secretory pathway component GspD/PulD (secretin)